MLTPIYFYKTDSLTNLKANSLIALKTTGEAAFSLFITDKNGLPYPLKDEGGTGGITAIQNTDGNLTITGGSNKVINVSTTLLNLINSALQSGDNVSNLINDANYITLADIPTFVASDYDLEDFTNTSTDPFIRQSDVISGGVNLEYTPSPTQGTVTSDTGTDAIIPLADVTNAGLLKPAKYILLEAIEEAFTTILKATYDSAVSTLATLLTTGSRLITSGEITKLSNTSGTNTGDQIIPTTLPASDVYAWAKAATKPTYTNTEVGSPSGSGTSTGANTGDETTASLKTKIDEYLGFACSDEVSNLATGLVTTFRMPYAMTLSDVRISLTEAPTISSVIVDVKQGGTSIFSTLVSIDSSELTSVTAATPAVISTTALADDSLMTIHITQIGSGDTGKGLKLVLSGKKS